MKIYASAIEHARHNGCPAFTVGQRVQAHPGTDAWMRGDRFGTVERIGRAYVHVHMDASHELIAFHPVNLERIA